MNRDKQIEEMARIICAPTANKGSCEKCGFKKHCSKFDDATDLYNAGYRQASEVAAEIFEEIEKIRLRYLKKYEFFRNGSREEMERKYFEGAEWGLRQLTCWLAELEKKYAEDEG